MPRRPRPVSRGGQPKIKKAPSAMRPKALSNSTRTTKPNLAPKNAPPAKRNLKRPAQSEPDEEDEEDEGDQFFGSSGDEDDEDSIDEDRGEGPSRLALGEQDMGDVDGDDDENDDADAPRVALWEPDEEGLEDESEEEEEDVQEKPKEKAIAAEKSLKNSLQDLPLGALRHAQRMLAQAAPDSDSDSDQESATDDDDGGPPEAEDLRGTPREKVEKVEWSTKRRTDIAKRSSKHAPTEVTSKRPVSRKRQVVDVPKIVLRDPRFMTTTGEFDPNRFSKSYAFLADNHKTELSTLKDTLARARKLLSSSPRDLRAGHEAEVHRLEQAVKRTESLVNRDKLQAVEREALGRVKKTEREGRAQGKGQWHLKRGERQKVVMQARYEALEKEGGQRAVKKAIEKKQKKVSQKEKRSRPYAKGEFSGGGDRQRSGDRPFKRRRV